MEMMVLLFAEDQRVRRMVEVALPLEFELRTGTTAAEVLWGLTSEPIDVLVTDLDVAEGGEEMAHLARALPRAVGVVVLSSSPERLVACRGPAHVMVAKPFPLTPLRAAIRHAAVWAYLMPPSSESGPTLH